LWWISWLVATKEEDRLIFDFIALKMALAVMAGLFFLWVFCELAHLGLGASWAKPS
jgi:hypothetical protein